MANKSEKQGKSSGATGTSNTHSSAHSGSSTQSRSSAQRKNSQQSTGRDSSSGRPDEMRNQSGRQGSTKQYSSRDDIDTNGGAPSRQTSEAGSKSGQL